MGRGRCIGGVTATGLEYMVSPYVQESLSHVDALLSIAFAF